MAELESAIAYIVQKYPHKGELSNARVTKMLYLADWYGLINNQDRVTNIRWYFDNYGPFVWDIKDAVDDSKNIGRRTTENLFGSKKEQFYLENENFSPNLSKSEMGCIDHVIESTKSMYWDEFIKLVYSTYPVASSEKYSFLDLEEKAKEYMAF